MQIFQHTRSPTPLRVQYTVHNTKHSTHTEETKLCNSLGQSNGKAVSPLSLRQNTAMVVAAIRAFKLLALFKQQRHSVQGVAAAACPTVTVQEFQIDSDLVHEGD